MRDLMQTVKNYVWWTLVLVALFSFIVFSFQNSQTLSVTFLIWSSPSLPFPYYIFAAFGVGVFFAGFVGLFEIFRLKARIRKMRRMNELLEREVDALRNQPLFDEPPSAAQPPSTTEDA